MTGDRDGNVMKKLLLIFCLLLFAAKIEAATYWVSKSGTDVNGCTNTTTPLTTGAKQTISAGVGCLASGDTLMIGSGTYTETLNCNVTCPPSGTDASHLTTIAVAPGNSVIWKSSNGASIIALVSVSSNTKGNYVHITGQGATLEFDGTGMGGAGGTSNGDSGIATNQNTTGIKLSYLKVHNVKTSFCVGGSAGAGLLIGGANHLIDHVESYDNGHSLCGDEDDSGYGIYFSAHDSTVQYSTLHANGGHGIHSYHAGGGANNNVLRWNTIYGNGIIATSNTSGIISSSGSGHKIYGNVVANQTHGSGIEFGPTCVNCEAYNNTVHGNTIGGIVIQNDSGAVVRNNIITNTAFDPGGSGYGAIVDVPGAGFTHDHNLCFANSANTLCDIVQNPLYVNSSALNFQVQTGSPAIGAGANLGSPYNTDMLNVTRPAAPALWTIGAYEFGAAPSCPAVANALVASYGFEGNGNDSSGVNTATLGSGWSYTTGKYGQGIVSTGVSGITVADADALDPCNGFTFEGWVNLPNTSGDYAFIVKNPGSKAFLFSSLSGICGSGMPAGGYSEGTQLNACYATALSSGWQHLAVTYDATLPSANVKLYLNGTPVTTANGTALLSATTGTLQFCTSGFGETCPSGTIVDEVRIYNYARSGAQIVTDRDTPVIAPALTPPTLKVSGTMKFGASAVALKLRQ